VTAQEALALGFVNEVAPAGEALAAAKRWAAEILACSPLSVRASKQALMRGLDEPSLAQAVRNEREYPAARAMLESQDYIEGPKAFAEKRKPQWLGR
jgi:enoyl-CoA hydratase/carnithine racemase